MGNSFAVLFWVWVVVSWFTHIFTCFADAAWGFLIAGAVMFPIAVFHGTWVWFT
jgi:hypothetical protein